jgi:hypothetical protein
LHGEGDAFAEVDIFVAVAKFPRFVSPGTGSAGHSSPAEGTVFEDDIDFYRRIAATVENLTANHIRNQTHSHLPDLTRLN